MEPSKQEDQGATADAVVKPPSYEEAADAFVRATQQQSVKYKKPQKGLHVEQLAYEEAPSTSPAVFRLCYQLVVIRSETNTKQHRVVQIVLRLSPDDALAHKTRQATLLKAPMESLAYVHELTRLFLRYYLSCELLTSDSPPSDLYMARVALDFLRPKLYMQTLPLHLLSARVTLVQFEDETRSHMQSFSKGAFETKTLLSATQVILQDGDLDLGVDVDDISQQELKEANDLYFHERFGSRLTQYIAMAKAENRQ
jgi:hypothetical protein